MCGFSMVGTGVRKMRGGAESTSTLWVRRLLQCLARQVHISLKLNQSPSEMTQGVSGWRAAPDLPLFASDFRIWSAYKCIDTVTAEAPRPGIIAVGLFIVVGLVLTVVGFRSGIAISALSLEVDLG